MHESGLTRDQLEGLLYGGRDLLRFTQDSPILPDVWMEYARYPTSTFQLLLTPYQGTADEQTMPGQLSKEVRERLKDDPRPEGVEEAPPEVGPPWARVSYNRTTVLVPLRFHELVRVVLPMSGWWSEQILGASPERRPARGAAQRKAPALPTWLAKIAEPEAQKALVSALAGSPSASSKRYPPVALWLVRVVGTIHYLSKAESAEEVELVKDWLNAEPRREESSVFRERPRQTSDAKEGPGEAYREKLVAAFAEVMGGLRPLTEAGQPRLHLVSLNRKAFTTICQSRGAVKADVAYRIFGIDCSELTWAVVDSGIDARHPAFRERVRDQSLSSVPIDPALLKAESRVVRTFDFTIVEHLLNPNVLAAEGALPGWLTGEQRDRVEAALRDVDTKDTLKESLQSGKEVDWNLLLPLIEVPHDKTYREPKYEHGTHVAGIIGAVAPDEGAGGGAVPRRRREVRNGMCPDIRLYDLRVLGDNGQGGEFNVIAALQFVRHLNANSATRVINGVNLSLSIRHEVANYACGCTPVCDECRRLVGAGIVVVAAAGNEGYQQYVDVNRHEVDMYRYISITDPGNAEDVITVGATHRSEPHTYGVSYFSSRGPTGDGRAKPDLVAPGEKIESAVPCPETLGRTGPYRTMDGTSMAAPHVSGAAALLIARHRELDGKPAEVKRVLCETATDLGRERYFQGHGMLDVLRAIQSF